MRRSIALAAAALAAVALTAPSAQAAPPLFADFWDVKLQSTNPKLKGNAGRRTSVWNFSRPRVMNFTAYRLKGIKKLKMKVSRGWLVSKYRVRQGCYRANYIHRMKATRSHDIHGERVASRAKVRYFNSWRTCSGDSFRSWFKGSMKRELPQAGGAEISYHEPDPCDTALIEHSANEGANFFEWDGTFSYHWTFSDGGTSTEAEPRHRYPGPGNHTATVLMREIDGNAAKGTETIEVQPAESC